jgi:hypothetical protein
MTYEMRRSRTFVLLLAVLGAAVLVAGGAFAWKATQWHDEYGVWNPMVVRDIQEYEPVIGPVYDRATNFSTAPAPSASAAEQRASTFDQIAVLAEEALALWRGRQVEGRFATHWQLVGRELEASVDYHRTTARLLRQAGTTLDGADACREHALMRAYLEAGSAAARAYGEAIGDDAGVNEVAIAPPPAGC